MRLRYRLERQYEQIAYEGENEAELALAKELGIVNVDADFGGENTRLCGAVQVYLQTSVSLGAICVSTSATRPLINALCVFPVMCAGTLGVGDYVRCRYHGGPIFYIAQVEGVTWGDPVPYAPEHRCDRKREGCEE